MQIRAGTRKQPHQQLIIKGTALEKVALYKLLVLHGGCRRQVKLMLPILVKAYENKKIVGNLSDVCMYWLRTVLVVVVCQPSDSSVTWMITITRLHFINT